MTSKAMTWKNEAIFYFDYQELSLMKHKKFKGDNELFFLNRRLKDIVTNIKWTLINLIMTIREVINSI